MKQGEHLYALAFSRQGKVLIVDDLQVNVIILRQLLSGDYDVQSALSGEDAIAKSLTFSPDLILLDIEMPGMSGFEVCERLKAEPSTSDIAIMFVSAHHDEAIEIKGFELGCVDFIHKPVNALITKARVENQMLLKRQSDVLRFLMKQEADIER